MSKTTTSVKEWWKSLKAFKKINESMLCQVKKNISGHLKAGELLLEDLSV